MHASTLLVGSGLVSLAFAGYTLEDDYSGDNFFNMMTFDTVGSARGLQKFLSI